MSQKVIWACPACGYKVETDNPQSTRCPMCAKQQPRKGRK